MTDFSNYSNSNHFNPATDMYKTDQSNTKPWLNGKEKAQPEKPVYSVFDSNKNDWIELEDQKTKSFMQQGAKNIKTERIDNALSQFASDSIAKLSNLNNNLTKEYNNLLQQKFSKFQYADRNSKNSSANGVLMNDSQITQNLDKQKNEIASEIQNTYNQEVQKIKQEAEKESTVDAQIARQTEDAKYKGNQANKKEGYSQFDSNKNKKIEISDTDAKLYMAQKMALNSKGASAEEFDISQFNAHSVYNQHLEKSFKSFNYANAEIDESRIKSNMDAQAETINKLTQADYEKAIDKAKKKMKDTEFMQFRQDYKTAKSEFESHLKKDKLCEDVADIAAHAYNNSLIKTTGNTADMVREDLNKYNQLLKDFAKSDSISEMKQIKAQLKNMDIINRVKDYNTSQENGGVVVKVTTVTATGLVAGPGTAALVAGGLSAADEVSGDMKNGQKINWGNAATKGLYDAGLTYAGGKVVGAMTKGLSNSGIGQKAAKSVGMAANKFGTAFTNGARGVGFTGRQAAENGASKIMDDSVHFVKKRI